jgi:hypothetical protein
VYIYIYILAVGSVGEFPYVLLQRGGLPLISMGQLVQDPETLSEVTVSSGPKPSGKDESHIWLRQKCARAKLRKRPVSKAQVAVAVDDVMSRGGAWECVHDCIRHYQKKGRGVVGIISDTLNAALPLELRNAFEDVVPAPDFLYHDTILNVAEQHEELLPVIVNKDLKEGRPSCLLAVKPELQIMFTCSAKNRFFPISDVDCGSSDCSISVSAGQSASDSVPYSGSGLSTPAADGSTSRTQVMYAQMSYSGNEVNDRRQSLLVSYLTVKEGDRVRVTLPLQGPFGAAQDREGVKYVWCHLLDGTHEAGWLPESVVGMGDATEALQTLNRTKEQLEVIAKRLAALRELCEGTLSHQASVKPRVGNKIQHQQLLLPLQALLPPTTSTTKITTITTTITTTTNDY